MRTADGDFARYFARSALSREGIHGSRQRFSEFKGAPRGSCELYSSGSTELASFISWALRLRAEREWKFSGRDGFQMTRWGLELASLLCLFIVAGDVVRVIDFFFRELDRVPFVCFFFVAGFMDRELGYRFYMTTNRF